MATVLFIGGTGVISEAVTELAAARGIALTLLNRGTTDAPVPPGVERIVCDARDKAALAAAVSGRTFDAVVDWIAFTPEHVQADIDVFSGRIGQYVFISSATVYEKPPRHYLITERTPLGNPFSPYAQNKIACETLLMQRFRTTAFPCTIVRPSYTYGNTKIPSCIAVSDYTIVDRIRRGRPIIVHGDGQSLWTMTHNTDFAAAFLAVLGSRKALGQAYHITSDEVLTWDQIHQAIGAAVGIEPEIVHVTTDMICAVAPGKAAGLKGDKMYSMIFDNSKIKGMATGFAAKIMFAEGVKRSISWFEAKPGRMKINADANALIDRIISSAQLRQT